MISSMRHPNLSKSRFTAGLQCLKRLYLEYRKRELAGPVPESQQAFFLGFPYGIGDRFLKETGHPVAFVKRVTVSTLFGKPYLLDGHNNPGFSGGPVVFCPPGRKEFQVAAVVSGYRWASAPVRDQENRDTEFHLTLNPPKDTDGRREGSGRGWVRELQGRWPGVLG